VRPPPRVATHQGLARNNGVFQSRVATQRKAPHQTQFFISAPGAAWQHGTSASGTSERDPLQARRQN
ncbi:MAG: hypothetical protein ACR2NM_13160, partial [Bythopirellula sp.]